MSFNISALDNGKIIPYKSPSNRLDGDFVIVNNDYDQIWEDGRTHISRNTRNGVSYGAVSGKGVPATARFIDDRFVRFNCDLQEWVFSICCEKLSSSYTESRRKSDFNSLFRDNAWITNFAGTVTRQDCINKTNMDQDVPQIQPMGCGGTLLKKIGDIVKFGQPALLVEAINPLVGDYIKYRPSTHRWLFFRPTLSIRYWVDFEPTNDGHPIRTPKKQEWYQEPFHHFGEQSEIPVFGFIPDSRSSTGYVNIIFRSRCRSLGEKESVPNPFIMRYGIVPKNPYEGF